MADEKSYGWAGKILRVNLTTGSITTESTAPYRNTSAAWALLTRSCTMRCPLAPILCPRNPRSSTPSVR